MRVTQTVPLLRIFDIDKALSFYVGFLGFEVAWENRPDPAGPMYMQIEKAGCVLHLTEHHGDCCPGATVFLRVAGLTAFHREIDAKGYAFNRPAIEQAPYGANVMEVVDPFGNRLRFNEFPHEQASP